MDMNIWVHKQKLLIQDFKIRANFHIFSPFVFEY